MYCCGGLRARCKTRHFKPIYGQRGRKTTNTISSIQTEKNSFEIVTGSGKTVVGEFTSTDSIGSFSLKDKKGKTLETATNNNVVTIAEKGYEKIKFSASAVEVDKTTIPCLEIGADGKTWDLVKKIINFCIIIRRDDWTN